MRCPVVPPLEFLASAVLRTNANRREKLVTRVLVVYATNYGHTERAACAVSEGARSVEDVECCAVEARECDLETLERSDALVLGTPVHMGSVHWAVKKFIGEVLGRAWTRDRFIGRVGAVFATGGGRGGAGGGCELAMLSLLSSLAELGALLVPLPRNTEAFDAGALHWGPYVRSGSHDGRARELTSDEERVLRAHGANVARVARISGTRTLRSAFGAPSHEL